MYHFQTSFAALSEYPDLPSRVLKNCSIPMPTVNQTLTNRFVRFEINVLNLKYDFVQAYNTNTTAPKRDRFVLVSTVGTFGLRGLPLYFRAHSLTFISRALLDLAFWANEYFASSKAQLPYRSLTCWTVLFSHVWSHGCHVTPLFLIQI